MIDVHCHLLEKDFNDERERIINICKKELKAIINSSPYLPHFEKAIELQRMHKGFIFTSLAIHPIYINNAEKDIKNACDFIRKHLEISAVGEAGLDYFHVKDKNLQEKQRIMFAKFVELAKELKKPLVIHCRDAFDDCIEILKEHNMQQNKVMFHLFSSRKHLHQVLENGWAISIGPSIKKSKDIAKIARDTPLDRIMLETDSPWFAQPDQKFGLPTNVKIVAEKISEIKKIKFEEVDKQTDANAINFFNLKINI